MFGFSMEDMENTGSFDRFPIRVEKFKKKKKFLPVLQHYLWWLLHNCVTHPLIGFVPIKPLFEFHDWTSVKLNVGQAAITTEIEELKNCKKQLEKIKADLTKLNGEEEPTSAMYVDNAIMDINDDIERFENPPPPRKRRSKKTIYQDSNNNTSFTA